MGELGVLLADDRQSILFFLRRWADAVRSLGRYAKECAQGREQPVAETAMHEWYGAWASPAEGLPDLLSNARAAVQSLPHL